MAFEALRRGHGVLANFSDTRREIAIAQAIMISDAETFNLA
jgi:hypothetical protein